MKKYFILAAALTVMASCADEKFLGEDPGTLSENAEDGAIAFGFNMQQTTRADIYGNAAATLLGNNFYVMGTKGTEAATSPSPTLVFDNYLVHWGANTANTTESNTANWEYVGIVPGTTTGCTDKVKTGSYSAQTIKYWDYSQPQYDFFAFSVGPNASVSSTTPSANQIGVTTMAYGTALAGATAYTLYIPSVADLKETYITDIKEVVKANYGKEVQLQFKNAGAKVRVALYETVPGYSVKDVKFYASETSPIDHTNGSYVAPTENATLISANASGFPTAGSIAVSFPYIGNDNASAQAYDKASATVGVTSGVQTQQFGALTNQLVVKADHEDTTAPSEKRYLGRTLPTATFAGSEIVSPAFASSEDAQFYQAVFPVSTPYSLTLRVDYTLVSLDGSEEEIKIYGAKAVVPNTYTKWLPNYAYTYIFKISDNTNGWTDEAATAEGLFPITFDAVVAEATDANDQQKTITTVATPSITTYQQYHDITKDEYSKTVKNLKNETVDRDVYVRIMNEGTLVTGLGSENSVIYQLSKNASEAEVMDALLMRTTAVGTVSTADVTGRNGLELTNVSTNIDNDDTEIVNGVDDNPITVATGTVAKIDISALTADKSYAYVYVSSAKTKEVNQYEPVSVTVDSKIDTERLTHTFYALTTTQIEAGSDVASDEDPDEAYLYFSVTENGTGTKTYSYISPLGKGKKMPKGCKKVAKTTLESTTKTGNDTAAANTFYFDKYITNNGKYAVKVIKVVA